DIIRDAIVHRLRYLQTIELTDEDILKAKIFRFINEVKDMLEEVDQAEEMLKQINKACEKAIEKKDKKMFNNIISFSYTQLQEFPDPYKSRALDIIKRYKTKAKVFELFDSEDNSKYNEDE
ncbi:MAG: hypothetical protein QXU18_09805, partial [Thermoplasmatales archaeon]